jgi:hypothetical protein
MNIPYTKEAEFFLSRILAPLQNDEVYFIALSARNKYLTDEERKQYALNHTEMFAREIMIKNGTWDYIFRKLEGTLKAKRTKTGLEFPEKALVVYANINPSSAVRAIQQFKRELAEAEENVMRKILLNRGEPNDYDFDFFKLAKSKLYNAYQRNASRKIFLDIDMDVKNEEALHHIILPLTENKAQFITVETRGGFHIMVKRDTIKGNYIYKSIDAAKALAGSDENGKEYEIMFNPNAMVPVPGTMHGNFLVKIRGDLSMFDE